jgi:hypothetical protein
MAISPVRSASSSAVSRPSLQNTSAISPSKPQGLDGFSGAQKPGSKLSLFQQDGFDLGGKAGGADMNKLLGDTLSMVTSMLQLVAQALPALQGAMGAQGGQAGGQGGATGGQCGTGHSGTSSFDTGGASGGKPVDLSGGASSAQNNTGVVGPQGTQEPASTQDTQGTPAPTGTQGPGPTKGAEGGSKLGGNLPPGLEKFRGAIESASAKTGIPAAMLAAQIWQESRGDLAAVTTNGGNGLSDTGLMQVNPNTYGELQAKHPELQGKNLADPETNILAGAYYMKDMKEQFGGSNELALRAYNSGPNGVDRNDPNAIPAGTGDPTYVQKVSNFMEILSSGKGTLPA